MLSLLLAVTACTTDTPVDSADTGDTADTAEDTTPVWTQLRIESSSTINGIYASGGGVFAVGTGGFAWSGSGGEWTFMDIDVDGADITDLWGQGKDDDAVLAASTEGGTVAQFSAAGGWTTGTMGDTSALKGVGGSDVSSLFAVGWGRAWSYDGSAWVYETIPETGNKLNDVYGAGEKAFAVGDEGASLVRQGGAWSRVDTGVEVALNAVDGSGPSDVWAVGEAGTVLHNTGDGWELEEVPTTETLWAVFVPEEGVVYAVGSNGVAIRKTDGEWTRLYSGVDNILYAIHGATATNVWASGNRGMVLQYKD